MDLDILLKQLNISTLLSITGAIFSLLIPIALMLLQTKILNNDLENELLSRIIKRRVIKINVLLWLLVSIIILAIFENVISCTIGKYISLLIYFLLNAFLVIQIYSYIKWIDIFGLNKDFVIKKMQNLLVDKDFNYCYQTWECFIQLGKQKERKFCRLFNPDEFFLIWLKANEAFQKTDYDYNFMEMLNSNFEKLELNQACNIDDDFVKESIIKASDNATWQRIVDTQINYVHSNTFFVDIGQYRFLKGMEKLKKAGWLYGNKKYSYFVKVYWKFIDDKSINTIELPFLVESSHFSKDVVTLDFYLIHYFFISLKNSQFLKQNPSKYDDLLSTLFPKASIYKMGYIDMILNYLGMYDFELPITKNPFEYKLESDVLKLGLQLVTLNPRFGIYAGPGAYYCKDENLSDKDFSQKYMEYVENRNIEAYKIYAYYYIHSRWKNILKNRLQELNKKINSSKFEKIICEEEFIQKVKEKTDGYYKENVETFLPEKIKEIKNTVSELLSEVKY